MTSRITPIYTLSVAFCVDVTGDDKNFKFGTRLIITISPGVWMTNHPERGAVGLMLLILPAQLWM